MGVSAQPHATAALSPGKTLYMLYIGGWVDPRAGLGSSENLAPPPPGFDPRTVLPVASRCTDYAILAHVTLCSPVGIHRFFSEMAVTFISTLLNAALKKTAMLVVTSVTSLNLI